MGLHGVVDRIDRNTLFGWVAINSSIYVDGCFPQIELLVNGVLQKTTSANLPRFDLANLEEVTFGFCIDAGTKKLTSCSPDQLKIIATIDNKHFVELSFWEPLKSALKLSALSREISHTDAENIVIINDVLIGKNQNLYLAYGGHNVLDYLNGKRETSEESFKNFYTNIKNRAKAVSDVGSKYIHAILPDKHAVLDSDFPIKSPNLLGMQFMSRYQEVLPQLLYLRDILVRSIEPTFMRTDTHLNARGNAIAATKIAEILTGEMQAENLQFLLNDISVKVNWCGDLGSKLEPKHTSIEFQSPTKWIEHVYHNNIVGGNNGMMSLLFNSGAVFDKRLVLFGDSFGHSICHFLAYYFKEVAFFRTPFFHQELFADIKSDYVVTENVERYLNHVGSDTSSQSFFSFPSLNNDTYMPSESFREALSAVLNYGTEPYNLFLDKISQRS